MSNRRRMSALLFGIGLGLTLAAGAWQVHRVLAGPAGDSGDMVLVGDPEEQRAMLEERARAGNAVQTNLIVDPRFGLPAPELVREPLDERSARGVFPQLRARKSGIEYDPHAYFRFRADIDRRLPNKERPERTFRFRTNNVGLREADNLRKAPPDVRVFVTGDSQTEGYGCNVEESFPNALERVLAAERAGRSVEVWNAAQSGYHFYNYVGVLERFLPYQPDTFVLVVYGGNDFAESLLMHHYFHRTRYPRCDRCSLDKTLEAHPELPVAVFNQYFYQLVIFLHHVEQREAGLVAGKSVVAEMQRLCHENGVRFLCAYLPPAFDVQPEFFADEIEIGLSVYELSRDDLRASRELADEWLEFLRGRGIESIDLTAALSGAQEQLYWDGNLHLNPQGNERVGRALAERFPKGE